MAWIGQAALITVAARVSPKAALVWGLAIGTIANGIAFHWAPEALGVCMDAPWLLAALLFGLLVVWESIAFAAFCGATSWLLRRSAYGLWLIPAAWVVAEHTWPKIFPWLLGYTQLEFLPMIQIAELTGACGIGFVMTAVCLVPVILSRHTRPTLATGLFAASALWLFAVSLTFGTLRQQMWSDDAAEGRPLRLALLQVNVGNMGAEKRLLATTADLGDQVDLVVWPESALGVYCSEMRSFREPEQTLKLSRHSLDFLRPTLGLKCDVLAGGKTYDASAADDGPYRMTALLIGDDERIVGRYYKRTLIPFGEYVPGQDYWPALRDWATLTENIERGTSAEPLLTSRGDRLGVVICYEDLVRSNVLETARARGEILLSIINDGAFENPLTLRQHERLARLRAVEHRKYFARCASTGVTCLIDPSGAIVDEVPINGEGTIVRTVQLNDVQTPYTRYGEWFPATCAFALVIGTLALRRSE